MNESAPFVRTDAHGVMRVASSRVMLDSVVAGFEQGLSPETIQQQYPALTLEQVYGAIAYYLGCRERVDEYLQKQQRLWDEQRSASRRGEGAVVERLRSLQNAQSR